MSRVSRAIVVALPLLLSAAAHPQADYPGAHWVPADPGNFSVANRPTSHPIRYIVIHVMQGSYNGAISWFQNPASNVSAHYLMRATDGDITQMVREKDIGYHAGNWTYNTQSVGIEHEGFVSDPSWFTPTVYESSARLSRYLSLKYGFARDRQHIVGHVEVPGATHTDPGPFWDWTQYMNRVRLGATYGTTNLPGSVPPGQLVKVLVSFINDSDDAWERTGPNPVRLVTVNPPGRASAFYTPGAWPSASTPATVYTTTVPGMKAAFIFPVTAPSTPGLYSESFQLEKVGVGRFGPVVTFNVAVGIADTVKDNDGPDFEAIGSWSTGTTAPGHYGADYRFAATPTANACNWFLNAPAFGYYDVYAWWSQGTNRSTAVTYSVLSGSNQWDSIVDQQTNGGKWNLLGRYWLSTGGGFVRLSATGPAGKVAIADAVRIVGPFPAP